MRRIILITLCSLIVGCAGDRTVVVKHEPYKVEGNLLAQVKIKDMRSLDLASSKLEALGMPMGEITFDPTEAQIVKNALEVELTRLMKEKVIQTKRDFSCDIVKFDVNTKSTPLYWDVVGRIQLVLKQNSKEYSLVGTHTERTYVWPGEAVINKTLDGSLSQIIAQLKQVSIE